MSRPTKNTVDYFPFICKEGKSMYYIENKYGNNGFAVWIKILRQLAVTNFHFLNLNQDEDWLYLAAKCKVDENLLMDIINDLVRLGEFDHGLWTENKVLASEKFMVNISEAYKKRNTNPPSLQSVYLYLQGLGVRKPPSYSVKVPIKPERIEENRIEKKSIEYYITLAREKFDTLKNDDGWVEVCAMNFQTPKIDIENALAFFFTKIPPTNYENSEKNLKQHFYNWYAKNKTTWQNEKSGKQSNTVEAKHAEFNELETIAARVLQSLTGT